MLRRGWNSPRKRLIPVIDKTELPYGSSQATIASSISFTKTGSRHGLWTRLLQGAHDAEAYLAPLRR